MKSLSFAIAATIALTSVVMPALQVRAADESTQEQSAAWKRGYADAVAGKFVGKVFENPYPLKNTSTEDDASNNTDYIAGFIAGKSARGN